VPIKAPTVLATKVVAANLNSIFRPPHAVVVTPPPCRPFLSPA
jgi:hypothetical protein